MAFNKNPIPTMYLSTSLFNPHFKTLTLTKSSPLFPLKKIYRCSSSISASKDDGESGHADESKKRLSEQSSWEAKDSEGKDYLYRLGKEADNMNIAVGARAGVIDDLFTGQFLGRDCMYTPYLILLAT